MTVKELMAHLMRVPPESEVIIEQGNMHLHIAALTEDDSETTFIHAWPYATTYPQ